MSDEEVPPDFIGDPDGWHFSQSHPSLRADLDTVRRFRDQHPDVWQLSAEVGPPPRFLLLLPRSAEARAEELRGQLQHPELLEMRKVPYSRDELEATWREVWELLETSHAPPYSSGVSFGEGVIEVDLPLSASGLARQLEEAPGGRVRVTLGNFVARNITAAAPASRIRGSPGDRKEYGTGA